MIKIPPPLRKSRGRLIDVSSPRPTVLTLVAASYEPGVALTLGFNQAIDITAFNGAAITVNDGVTTHSVWQATGAATLLSATTMRVLLDELLGSLSSTVAMTAAASTGIVATVGGATWGGVTNLHLPFP